MPTELEIAWAAGLFEGEGCITIGPSAKGGRLRVRFALAMTDEDVVRKFHKIAGCGNVNGPVLKAGDRKPQWRFFISKPQDVAKLAEWFAPHLGARRLARLKECLAEYAAQPEKRHWQTDKTHCPHGHEFTDSNTLYWANGSLKDRGWKRPRRCRECQRLRSQERNRAERELRDVAKRMREIEAVTA